MIHKEGQQSRCLCCLPKIFLNALSDFISLFLNFWHLQTISWPQPLFQPIAAGPLQFSRLTPAILTSFCKCFIVQTSLTLAGMESAC